MIQAKELRIGNLVTKSLKSGNGRKLDSRIGCEDIVRIYNNTGSFFYDPIPITEEWLLKFGFEKCKNNWYNIKYFTDCEENLEEMKIDYNLMSKRLSIYDAIEDTDMVNILSHPIYTSKRLEYVHTLQNLYFALTQKELSVT
jgi:hypothetical protein